MTYTDTYRCMYVLTHMYILYIIYVHVYIYIYVYMCVCVHMYIYIYCVRVCTLPHLICILYLSEFSVLDSQPFAARLARHLRLKELCLGAST